MSSRRGEGPSTHFGGRRRLLFRLCNSLSVELLFKQVWRMISSISSENLPRSPPINSVWGAVRFDCSMTPTQPNNKARFAEVITDLFASLSHCDTAKPDFTHKMDLQWPRASVHIPVQSTEKASTSNMVLKIENNYSNNPHSSGNLERTKEYIGTCSCCKIEVSVFRPRPSLYNACLTAHTTRLLRASR